MKKKNTFGENKHLFVKLFGTEMGNKYIEWLSRLKRRTLKDYF
jgi:hypothetical protein